MEYVVVYLVFSCLLQTLAAWSTFSYRSNPEVSPEKGIEKEVEEWSMAHAPLRTATSGLHLLQTSLCILLEYLITYWWKFWNWTLFSERYLVDMHERGGFISLHVSQIAFTQEMPLLLFGNMKRLITIGRIHWRGYVSDLWHLLKFWQIWVELSGW